MDEKEMNDSTRQKRSKSVPAMYPVGTILNDTQLQAQLGRSRSNTADSVERIVRTQRSGARLSSGGLLRNQSKKRRNKNGLEKSRSVDVIDLDESSNSSRKSSNSSQSSEVSDEDQAAIRTRKQGFCLPSVGSVVEKLTIMEDEQEFPNKIDSEQTNSSIVCSASEEAFLGDRQLKSTVLLHDEYETSKLCEDDNSCTPQRTDNIQQREKVVQEQMYEFKKELKTNVRRRSLPADSSKCDIDLNLGDYSEGHENRARLTNTNQTDMIFQNKHTNIYNNHCQNNWRRWHSLPESLHEVSETYRPESTGHVTSWRQETNTLDNQQTLVLVDPIDMQNSKQSQENGNATNDSCNDNQSTQENTMADNSILEQQHLSNYEENTNVKHELATKRGRSGISKFKRSYSLPVKFDVVDEDERQGKEMRELKRSKSLSTQDEFDEVFQEMLPGRSVKLEPGNEQNRDAVKDENHVDVEGAVVHEKPKRLKERRRRAKSLPVILALAEIPEESPEEYNYYECESLEDMAKKHVNRAFQELLRKIRTSQGPRHVKVKRSRSLSTIKEIAVLSESAHEDEPCQEDKDVTLEKTHEEHAKEQRTTEEKHEDANRDASHEQHELHEQHATEQRTTEEKHETKHEDANGEDASHEQHELHEGVGEAMLQENIHEKNNVECFHQVHEELQKEHENYTNELDDLKQSNEQELATHKEDEQTDQEKYEELQEKHEQTQLEEQKHETFGLQQEAHEKNEEQANKEHEQRPTQEGIVMYESLNEQVNEERSSIHKAKEELHMEIPQILVSEVGFEQCQPSAVESNVHDDDVKCQMFNDEFDEQEGSGEHDKINPQTEELKSPEEEDIQDSILQHFHEMDFTTFDSNINQRSKVNVVPCMERIPEDPDKETALDSAETSEEQSSLKRAGSMRRGRTTHGTFSGSRKESWPQANNNKSDQPNPDQKRVSWSDTHGITEIEDDEVTNLDQEDGYQDQYEPGPRGDITFTGLAGPYTLSGNSEHNVSQDEFVDGPRGDICFTGSVDEHTTLESSDHYEPRLYHQEPEECDNDPMESKFDNLLRNAINSYLEPDYSQSESPIHQAVALGSIEHLSELIENGADVNAQDEHGWPPLHVAALFNNVDCAALLLEAGADLEGYTESLVHEYHTLRERVC